ncbi:MAG: DUF3857 domain-containing protein [Flavobacteriales bacterium]|nr:DUF3857 domain-containing protein [Flavobacteriales bacterium]
MRRLISSTLIIFAITVSAQERPRSDAEKKAAADLYFSKDDQDFSAVKGPDQWAGESAIILAQQVTYSYLKKGRKGIIEEAVRRRIKLQDKSAVENFSEYYFYSFNAVGVRITKSDGSIVEPDLSKAVPENEGRPGTFASPTTENIEMKLAIPNLEVGDILDYYEASKHTTKLKNRSLEYDPHIATLEKDYPILMQRHKFIVDRDFHLAFASTNGAPQIMQGPPGLDAKGKVNESVRIYVFTDTLKREKLEDELWSYHYLDRPTIKYQVFHEVQNELEHSTFAIDRNGGLKSSATGADVQAYTIGQINGDRLFAYLNAAQITDYLDRYHPGVSNTDELINLIYYYMRYRIMLAYFTDWNGNMVYEGVDNLVYAKDIRFLSTLLEVFKKKNIDAQIIAAVPRHMGTLDDLLLMDELKFAMRVNKTKIIYPFSNFSTMGYVDSSLEGVDAWVFNYESNNDRSKWTQERMTLPYTSDSANYVSCVNIVNIDSAFGKVAVKRTTTVGGNMKNSYSVVPLYNTDYLLDDREELIPTFWEESGDGKTEKAAELKRKKDEAYQQREKSKSDALKEDIEDDFDKCESYDGFKLVSDGRWEKSPLLIYEDQFTLTHVTNPAGKNFILDVGMFIGGQFQLTEKQMTRHDDIHMSSARSFNNKIIIPIPDGYYPDGLENLVMNVDNDYGTFTSTVEMQGDSLVVETLKRYKHADVKKEDWPQMIRFLDTAFDFSQKKLIFRRKEESAKL